MAFGQVNLSLRPIKFGMLVDPNDQTALLQAVRLNLFLWGGTQNPIIPVYREVPSIWAHLSLSPPPPNDIIEGYIRIFDPDVLVTCGNVDATVGCGNDRKIISVGELTGELSKRGVPGHGIGLFEILRRFAEKEFKFVRRNPLKVLVPTYEVAENQLFLTSIFGDVPPEAPREIYEPLFQYIETDQPSAGIDTYVNLMDGKSPFLRHLCNFDLNIRRPSTDRSDAIFLLDHTNALDIIDYWNLRAIGWTVVPIASAVKVSDGAKKLAQDFIAEHEGRDEEFPNFEHRVTILKGRSIAEDDHIAFVNSLRRKPGQILTCQLWYPPMWDEFTYQRGNLRCSEVTAGEAETTIGEGDPVSPTWLKTVSPDFMEPWLGAGWRYANDIKVSIYGRREFGAAAFPPEAHTVASLFGFGDSRDWRISAGGISFLGHYSKETIPLQQPGPIEVIFKTLNALGWKNAKISPAGNVAYQMMRHLGGPFGIRLLKNRKLIEFLEWLSKGQGRTAVAQHFFAKMREISSSYLAVRDIHGLVERYTDAKIFSLGVEVQCAICTQRSWHSVDSLEYEILCPKCLSKFKLPVHNPATELKWSYKSIGPFALPAEDDRNHEDEDAGAKMEWSYRSLGPFASPKQASGAYCVLLSVGFLCDHHHPATTPVLSFKGTKDDGKKLEADFMMFYRGLAFWENATEFVFGECKTFNRFKGIDIDRMKVISHDFPGAVLVFATLNDEFSAEEKDILIPFVNKCREYSKLDRPRNPVLLLTGTELFATFGPPRCWSDKAGKSKQFANARAYPHTLLELCDVTQQIYLDLDSWSKEWNEEFERRRRVGQKTIDGSEMQRIDP